MANKADTVPNQKEFAQDLNPSQKSKAEIEVLSKEAQDKNKKKASRKERESNANPEVKKRHWDITGRLATELKILNDKAKSKKGELRNAYGQAKDEGCNIEAMKRLRDFEKLDIHELNEEFQDMADLAKITGSPIAHTSFMQMLNDADRDNPYTLGYSAGLTAGEFNPPYTPGSEDFVKYETGYKDAQKKLLQGAFRGNKTKPPKEDGQVPSEKRRAAAKKKKS